MPFIPREVVRVGIRLMYFLELLILTCHGSPPDFPDVKDSLLAR